MSWFFDPKVFNVVMIVLCALAAARWTINGSWWQALYFAAATVITIAVTGGMK